MRDKCIVTVALGRGNTYFSAKLLVASLRDVEVHEEIVRYDTCGVKIRDFSDLVWVMELESRRKPNGSGKRN